MGDQNNMGIGRSSGVNTQFTSQTGAVPEKTASHIGHSFSLKHLSKDVEKFMDSASSGKLNRAILLGAKIYVKMATAPILLSADFLMKASKNIPQALKSGVEKVKTLISGSKENVNKAEKPTTEATESNIEVVKPAEKKIASESSESKPKLPKETVIIGDRNQTYTQGVRSAAVWKDWEAILAEMEKIEKPAENKSDGLKELAEGNIKGLSEVDDIVGVAPEIKANAFGLEKLLNRGVKNVAEMDEALEAFSDVSGSVEVAVTHPEEQAAPAQKSEEHGVDQFTDALRQINEMKNLRTEADPFASIYAELDKLPERAEPKSGDQDLANALSQIQKFKRPKSDFDTDLTKLLEGLEKSERPKSRGMDPEMEKLLNSL